MKQTEKLPIGIEDFKKMRTEGFYYVDKTGLITELLDNWGEVNLFTRPRRFGKSLNMSMLKYFFEYGCDSSLFEGLAIAEERDLCEKYMGKFPVVSITLKGVSGRSYETAKGMLCNTIKEEARRFSFLKESPLLMAEEKEDYGRLTRLEVLDAEGHSLPEEVLADSLRFLCRVLSKHYSQKVILLIDEYDVPLNRAERQGYYNEMVELIRGMFNQALKTNDSLQAAVLTGCLRVARESIFTGLNNLKVLSIMDTRYHEHFGFTDQEVKEMLEYYGAGGKLVQTREWYDGYRFGHADVYCPWDVINYVDLLRSDPEAQPRAFWANTSGNDIIRALLHKATPGTKRELERLIDGEVIRKKVNQELTYRDVNRSVDNIWSVMFATGYLTLRGETEGDILPLCIPNLEIRKLFTDQVMEWFREESGKDAPALEGLCRALLSGDAAEAQRLFQAFLARTISIRDTGARKGRKENFYHGILLGLLCHREDWIVESNGESGNGYSDILVEDWETNTGMVIEVKYPDGGNLEAGCREALAQIERMDYGEKLRRNGMETILKYGVACDRKRCRIELDSRK